MDKRVFAVGKEFCDSACKFSLLVEFEPIHIACAVLFGFLNKCVNPLSRLFEVVDGDCLYGLALLEERCFFAQNVSNILDNEGVAEVGFVRAVISHCVAISDSAERTLVNLVALGRELFEYAAEHFFHNRENILLRRKAHLCVELIEFAGASVRTCVLVSETRRDLEVFVKARRHKQLFVLLRRLRKCVKMSRIKSGRHDIVARALGGT